MNQSLLFKSLSWLRGHFTHLRLLIVFTLLYVASQLVIKHLLAPIGIGPFLSFQLTFSREEVLHTLSAWKAQGLLSSYASHLWPDMLHPLWYALMFIAALSMVMNANGFGSQWNVVLLLPVTAAICDTIENVIQIFFLANHEFVWVSQPLVTLSAAASITKWSLAILSVVIVMVLTVRSQLIKRRYFKHETS